MAQDHARPRQVLRASLPAKAGLACPADRFFVDMKVQSSLWSQPSYQPPIEYVPLTGHPTDCQVSNQDQSRFERIFEEELLPHADALKTFAYHLTFSDEDSNDLVQETYFKAYRFIDRYEEGTNAKAWLFKILKNAYINEYRKKARRPSKVDYEEVIAYHDSDDDKITGYMDLREDIFHYMMGDEVTLAINALPLDFRTVILLCDIEDFTYEEIAKIIDVPIGTVRSRLFRARNMLKEKLKKYAESLGYTDIRELRRKRNVENREEE